MWPWEHVLFAYVFYSLYLRSRYRARPEDWPVVALVFGSVLPDLVDKPLAWQFGVFESGYAAAHSVFVAVPTSLAVIVVAKRYGKGRTGAAFAIGYLLHLVGDVLPASLSRGRLHLDPILWPFADPHQTHHAVNGGSFLDVVYGLLSGYLTQLATMEITAVVALQLGSIVFGTVLWLLDGRPGLTLVREAVGGALERGRGR